MKKYIFIYLLIPIQIATAQVDISGEINFSDDEEYAIPSTQFGIHLGGYFKKAGEGDAIESYMQDLVSDLSPQVVRFPGGEISKFMHPFNATVGYGYDICEILAYYDVVDEMSASLDCDCTAAIEYVDENASDDLDLVSEVNAFFTYIQGLSCLGNYSKFQTHKSDIGDQATASETETYLEQFVDLLGYINEQNSPNDVAVVYCVNILTETADEVVNTLDYFRVNGIPIAGVELGNETYAKFYEDLFDDGFSDYYSFVKGNHTGTPSAYNELIDEAGGAGVIDHDNHDYIQAIRTFDYDIYTSGSIDIGLVAGPLDDFMFFLPKETEVTLAMFGMGEPLYDWNTSLENAKDDDIAIAGVGTVPTFDAIIVHPYFTPDTWETILEVFYEPLDGTPDGDDLHSIAECYDFEDPDSELFDVFEAGRDAFYTVFDGSGGGFQRFQSLIESYNTEYDFFTGGDKKELWTTEWNLKDHKGQNDTREYLESFNNSTIQAYLLFEWYLEQVELNTEYPSDLNYHTISTIHNTQGESNGNLISLEDDLLGDQESPYEENYIQRTPYAAFKLLNKIYNNNLNYIRTTFDEVDAPSTEAYDLLNVHAFLTPIGGTQYMYVYYSNMFEEDQYFSIDDDFLTLFSRFYCGDYYQAEISFDQLYSTAGNNFIYSINTCYDEFTSPPFEIAATNIEDNIWYTEGYHSGGGLVINVPAYTIGYAKLYLTNSCSKFGDLNTFTEVNPNPFRDRTTILFQNDENSIRKLSVFNMLGHKVLETEEFTGTTFEIYRNNLPSGIYSFKIEGNGIVTNNGTFIIQ